MKSRIRRGGLVAVVIGSVAMAAGAASVQADTGVPDDPVPTEEPAEQTPPSSNPDLAEEEVVPTAPLPTDTTAPSTPPPASFEPARAEVAPTTTLPPASSEPVAPQVVPTSTTPSVSRTSTTPQPATVTTTTTTRQPEASMSLLVATAPTAPRSPVAKPGNRSVKLTWLAPASNGGAAIDKYVVQRSRNKTTWTKIATTTGRRYTAKRLTNGTKYYFRVRAHNGAGFGPYSTTVKAVPRTRPTAPTSPVATPGNKTVKLTWKAPASDGGAAIDKYAVQRYTSTGWKTIAYPTTRSYTATGLTNGTNYSFRIRAHNAAGWGPFSTAVSAVPRTKPSAPRSPAATPGNGTVELTWLAPSSTGGAAIDKYAVQQAMTSTGPWTTIATPTGNDHTASGLTNGTTYYFRILAHNAAGYGAASTVLGSVPFTVPNAPQSLVATPSPSPDAGYGAVTLTWLAPASNGAAIDTYILRYRKLWDPTSPFMSAFQGSNLSATFRWLTPGEQYLFEVVARNAAGVGPAAYVAATAATVPTEPTACSAVQMSDSKTMYVDWGAPTSNGWAPITSYELKLYTYNGNSLVTTATTAGADTNHYMAVPAFGWYWVEIVARNAAGESPNCWVDVNIKDPDLP